MAYNVLIVDDSNLVRKVLMKTFGMTSIDVGKFFEAENGKVGLDILKDNWIDVVFLDVNMPVMNGIEFMNKLRSEEEYKNLPVIVVSTEGSTERINELETAGIKAYLRKPVTPEQLVTTIESVFGEVANVKSI